jgi:arginine decarboxylase
LPTDPRQLDQHPTPTKEQLYFEVLVVESMTEAQESALRKEVRGWRRPDDESPDRRAQILASSLAELRPELDLYLTTEIEVEDIAGRLGEYFRRVFHAREGVLELHLSILQGVAARYRTPFFSALKQHSHRPTGLFHALPISQGKSIVNSHWIKDMVGFYGLDVFLAETSSTCGTPTSPPTAPRRPTRS